MTTVDDLVVSLTIKPTSELGRLQRQLDALVGKAGRGVGAGMMFIKRDLINIKRDTRNIKETIRWLRPTVLPGPGETKAQMRMAGITKKNIQDYGKAMIESWMKTRRLPGMLETTGAKNIDELRESLRWTLEELEDTADAIITGTSGLTPQKISNFNLIVSEMVEILKSGRELGKTQLTKIAKFMPHRLIQETMAKIMEKTGIKTVLEKGFYPGSSQTGRPKRADIEFASKNLGNLLGVFSEHEEFIKSMIAMGKEKGAFEIKPKIELSDPFIRQMEFYLEEYGKEMIAVIGRDITDEARNWLETKGIYPMILRSFAPFLEVLGLRGGRLTIPEATKEMEKLAKDEDMESLVNNTKLIAQMIDRMDSEQTKEYGAIKTLIENLARQAGFTEGQTKKIVEPFSFESD